MLLKTKIEIENWLNKYNIKNYSLIEDNKYGYIVNVNDSVYLSSKKLINIDVKFNKVNGGFFCFGNKLKSLKGCPEEVNGHFDCSDNELESLDGPKIINGNFYCHNNKINNLERLNNLLNMEIQNNYIHLANNPELYELQYITDFNEIKKILKIYKEKNELNSLIITDDEIIKKNIIKI